MIYDIKIYDNISTCTYHTGFQDNYPDSIAIYRALEQSAPCTLISKESP